MAKTVASVALTQPSSDPAINEAGTFTMGGQATEGGSGQPASYDMHFQFDQGIGTWVNLSGSGSLTTGDTNPEPNISDYNEHTITVTGFAAGTYEVRIKTVDHRDSEAEDLSTPTQTVTVSAVGGADRRIFIIS